MMISRHRKNKQLCHCKCGGYAKPGNKFINGHFHPKGIPKKRWRTYKEAEEYARPFGFKNQKEWREHCKSGKKPEDIPASPEKTYKNKGWRGYEEFLGHIPRQMKPGSALPIEEAKKILHPLRIPDQQTFYRLSKNKQLPAGIPGNPARVYRDKGWKGFPDLLGYIPKRPARWDISYDELKDLLRPLKIRSAEEFYQLRNQDKLPKGVPRDPYDLFKADWKGWPDLLGYTPKYLKPEDRLPFEVAKRIVQSLHLSSQKEFQELSAQNKLPKGIPGNPPRVYKEDWIDWADFLGLEETGWSIRKIKELLRGLIESNIVRDWGSREDEIVLYRILHTKGLLNIKSHNRHYEFFKNLPEAMHFSDAFKEIKEYAYSQDYSRDEIPPDLSVYTGIHVNPDNESEKLDTASNAELASLVRLGGGKTDPLDYNGYGSLESPKEILKSLDRVESINVDEEVMRFLVIHSVNKIWRYIIYEYEKGESNSGHIKSIIKDLSSSKNGNHYHDEVIDQFITNYNGSLQVMNNLPKGYSFKHRPKIMQAYVAHQLKTRPSFLNLSGIGAGKTLSAILASRVINSNRFTVVICPNDIVEQWAETIKEVFPDSTVITGKEAFHAKRDEYKRQYLVLNYDKFSLEDTPNLSLELGSQRVDFVILDEIHFVKVRGQSNRGRNNFVSQRHTKLVGLMSEIRKNNRRVKVLGMTGTPVINDLMEGRSLIELVTGKEYDDVSVNPTIPNASTLYEKFQLLSIREIPNYKINVKLIDDIEVNAFTDVNIGILVRSQSALEQILTKARIPEIIKCIKNSRKGKTIIFTEYVTGITEQLREALREAGFEYAEYTGSLKEFERFCAGKAKVLIASRPIVVGKDGLQKVCNNIIINTLPWTNAQYQQLVGRLVRRGQKKRSVKVHIIKSRLNGYPYDERMKWNRIIYKRTLADCAVDGVMPVKNLATRSQAIKELIVWFNRLERDEISTIERKDLNVKLSPVEVEQRIRVFGDFAQMNKKMNKEKSETTHRRIQENPMEHIEYHRQFREAKKNWSVIPVQVIAEKIRSLDIPSRFIEKLVIGDFGCGEAELSDIFGKNKVYSFDHHNILNEEKITVCDMKTTPVKNGELDVAIFSLSLMGVNWSDYIREARRCLAEKGYLMIAETSRSLSDRGSLYGNEEGRLHDLKNIVGKEGFEILSEEQRGDFTFITAINRST
jgi:superfamily II DNA or RNA helicase